MPAEFSLGFEYNLHQAMWFQLPFQSEDNRMLPMVRDIEQARREISNNFQLLEASDQNTKENIITASLYGHLYRLPGGREKLTWIRAAMKEDYTIIVHTAIFVAKILVANPRSRHNAEVASVIGRLRSIFSALSDRYEYVRRAQTGYSQAGSRRTPFPR